MKRWLPTVFALVVGFGLGIWLGLSQRPDVPEPAATQPAGPSDTPVSSESPEEKPVIDEAPSPPATTNVEQSAAFTFSLPDVPTGDGEISGYVKLTDGSACAGLGLRITPSLNLGVSQTRRRLMSVDERAALEAAQARWELDASRSVTTSDDGSFKFTAVSSQHYFVDCTTPGWQLKKVGGPNSLYATAGDKLDLLATALRLVPVTVLMPDGTETERARLIVRSLQSNTSDFVYWSPSKREIEMPPGPVRITAAGGPNESLEGEVTVEIASTGDVSEACISLARPPGLYVTLEIPEPFYSDLRVATLPAEDAAKRRALEDPWMSRASKPSRKLSRTSWFFPALPEGDYVIYIGVEIQLVLEQANVKVTAGVTEFTLKLTPLELSEHFTVFTVDANNKPLANVRLSCTLADTEVAIGDSTACIELDTGKYLMRRPGIARDRFLRFVPTNDASIAVQAYHGGVKRFGRLPLDADEVTIQFGDACILVVEVDNLPETGRNDLWVAVVPAAASLRREAGMARYGGSTQYTSSRVGLEAKREFSDLQAGTTTVALFRDQSGFGEAMLVRMDVTLVPGTQTVRLAVPALYELEVRTTPEQKARVLLVEGQGFSVTERTDDSGSLRIGSLMAGDYWVGNSTNGYMKVTLPASGGVDFAPLPHNCLHFGSYDSDGALYQKGMRRGDLVVAIDGQYFENRETLQAAWEAAQSAASVRLEIDRTGQTLHVVLAGDELATALRKDASFGYRRR